MGVTRNCKEQHEVTHGLNKDLRNSCVSPDALHITAWCGDRLYNMYNLLLHENPSFVGLFQYFYGKCMTCLHWQHMQRHKQHKQVIVNTHYSQSHSSQILKIKPYLNGGKNALNQLLYIVHPSPSSGLHQSFILTSLLYNAYICFTLLDWGEWDD